jgi:hypothetical protein
MSAATGLDNSGSARIKSSSWSRRTQYFAPVGHALASMSERILDCCRVLNHEDEQAMWHFDLQLPLGVDRREDEGY